MSVVGISDSAALPNQRLAHLPSDATSRLARLIMIVLALIVTLANAFKAVHIDDPLYLAIADQILKSPSDPYGGQIYWQQRIEPVYQVSISPPLVSYYLALLKLLGLQSDLGLHLGMAPWACLLSWSAVCLSLRWTRSYWPAVVTVLSAPVVVGFNLMLDVPVTALCLAGLEWWCRADDRYQHFRSLLDQHDNSSDSANLASSSTFPSSTSNWFTVLMSALLFSLAVLTKYVAVAVVAAIGLRILFRLQVRLWPIVFAPAFTFIAWQVFCRLQYGASQTEQGLGFLSRFQVDLARTLLERFAVLSVCWVTSWPILLVVLPFIINRQRVRASALVLAVGVIFFALCWNTPPRRAAFAEPQTWFLYPLFAAIGFMLIVFVLLRTFIQARRAERIVKHGKVIGMTSEGLIESQLPLLVILPALFVILFGPFVAIRSFLPIQLPFACLVHRRLTGDSRLTRFHPMLLCAGVIVNWALMVMIYLADFNWSHSYRSSAPEIAKIVDLLQADQQSNRDADANTRQQSAPGRYFVGHWGFQYYLERAGFEPWDSFRKTWVPGSILLMPTHADPQPVVGILANQIERVRSIDLPVVAEARDGRPARRVRAHTVTCNRTAHIHWYGSDFGEWPWGTRREPYEVVTVYRLK